MYIIVIHDMYVNLSDSGTCLNQTMNNPESCHEVWTSVYSVHKTLSHGGSDLEY